MPHQVSRLQQHAIWRCSVERRALQPQPLKKSPAAKAAGPPFGSRRDQLVQPLLSRYLLAGACCSTYRGTTSSPRARDASIYGQTATDPGQPGRRSSDHCRTGSHGQHGPYHPTPAGAAHCTTRNQQNPLTTWREHGSVPPGSPSEPGRSPCGGQSRCLRQSPHPPPPRHRCRSGSPVRG